MHKHIIDQQRNYESVGYTIIGSTGNKTFIKQPTSPFN